MFAAVLRTMGERTEQESLRRLQKQFGDVRVVRDVRPIGAAVRAVYEAGLAADKPWIVVCDADMLIVPRLRRLMQRRIDSADRNVWQVQGFVDDKLWGGKRNGGPRLIRAHFLAQIMGDLDEGAIRPEEALFHAYKSGARVINEVWAQHDYEQYYRDLHRKGAQCRRKFPKWGAQIVPRWRKSGDLDLRAAAYGWDDRQIDWPEKGAL